MEWGGLDRTLSMVFFVTPYSVTYVYVGTYRAILYWANNVSYCYAPILNFQSNDSISERVCLLTSREGTDLIVPRKTKAHWTCIPTEIQEEYLGRKA